MSGDQLATSFGDPNAQPPPPTPPPKKTPTSTIFPSPVFETPKQGQGHFEDSAGWTPRFAEEYSVFNTTPENLRGSPQATFLGHFGTFTPTYQPPPPPPSAGQKRRLSAEGIAEEIATHATHFSPNSNLPLPPVDPSHRLPSSPGALVLTHEQAQQAQAQAQSQARALEADPQEVRSAKKVRRGDSTTTQEAAQGQTATPPPSARKGERKLAPRVITDNMQHDHQQDYGDFSAGAVQHSHMSAGGYLHSPADMFTGFPMSAPASAPAFDAQAFWGPDAGAMDGGLNGGMMNGGMTGSLNGMDLDFSAAGANAFQMTSPVVPPHHRVAGSLDWGRANQMFQETGMLPQQLHQQPLQQQQQHQAQPQPEPQQQHHGQQSLPQAQPVRQQSRPQAQAATQAVQQAAPPAKRERPLAPKTMMPNLDTSALDQPMLDTATFHTPIEDPFVTVHPGDGVNPGLLFSRPPSSSMEAAVFNPVPQQPPSSSAPAAPQTVHQEKQQENGNTAPIGLGISKAPMRAELRRSASVKELGPSKQQQSQPNRAVGSGSSPIKSTSGRQGLSRSFSENRGKRTVGRPASLSSSSASSTLPVLAPAVKQPPLQPAPLPQLQQPQPVPGNPGVNASRPSSHGSRSSGRNSPPKAHHHHRLSSLTAIPEARARASVKLTIDANGRARVETIMTDPDNKILLPVPPSSIQRRRSTQPVVLPSRNSNNNRRSGRWDSTDEERDPDVDNYDDDDDDESSTDDELIVIPSRNTSFALPDPLKVSGSRARFHRTAPSQRSFSEHSTTSSSASFFGEIPQQLHHQQQQQQLLMMAADHDDDLDPESEAETVMNDSPSGAGAGDAASELEKLRQSRQTQQQQAAGGGRENQFKMQMAAAAAGAMKGHPQQQQQHQQARFAAGPVVGTFGGRSHQQQQQHQHQQTYHHHPHGSAVSPTTLTEASLPTPSTDSRSHGGVRCVCNSPHAHQVGDGGFMVQCESCEMWLHGKCINIHKRSMMPSVYICAYCARTPQGRPGRAPSTSSSLPASSPLAHKSFPQKFR